MGTVTVHPVAEMSVAMVLEKYFDRYLTSNRVDLLRLTVMHL